jgi:phenylalanyl-tRNA synthetase alpha chain
MEDILHVVLKEYTEKINQANSLVNLDELFLELFGKNGKVTVLPRDFSKEPKEKLKVIGPLFNQVKTSLEQAIEKRREEVREDGYKKLEQEALDLSEPKVLSKREGHIHPITQFENEIAQLFGKIGFERYEAPHIDTDHYNFEVLNIPKDHPARDLQDTLYLDTTSLGENPGNLLLRTHTSNAQVRLMTEYKTPLRMMIVDRCFRYENLDARHEHTFQQFEIVYVDKGVSMANLQYLSEYFLKQIFGQDIKVRLRPKYYPFVEPGAGVDGLCIFCKGKGCRICGGVGWLELAGAGMIHPTVLKNGGIDSTVYSGIAWGFGTYRIAMLKYGVEDVRVFNSGDLKSLYKLGENK